MTAAASLGSRHKRARETGGIWTRLSHSFRHTFTSTGIFTVSEYPVLEAYRGRPAHDPLRQATVVPMPHVIEFLRTYLRQHWDVLRHSQVKDSALGILVLLQKWGVQTPLVQSN